MVNIKKIIAIAIILLMTVQITGCSMFEKQQSVREDLVLDNSSGDSSGYKTAMVTKGDITITNSIMATAESEDSKELCYGTTGIAYDSIYVQAGETVKKGDLLGELDMTGIDEAVESAYEEYELAKLELEYIPQQIADEKAIGQYDGRSEEELETAIENLEIDKKNAEDSLELAEEKYKESLEAKAERQIYAPNDGIITFVYDPDEDNSTKEEILSNKKKVVFKISSGEYLFYGNTNNTENLKNGDKVTMSVDGQSYEFSIYSIKSRRDRHRFGSTVAFKMEEEIYGVTDGTLAQYEDNQVLSNVLYIPKDAVMEFEDGEYVYAVDENGLRKPVKVTTGLSDGSNIVVTDGLEEGQEVIVK